jgi:hypothetical protein
MNILQHVRTHNNESYVHFMQTQRHVMAAQLSQVQFSFQLGFPYSVEVHSLYENLQLCSKHIYNTRQSLAGQRVDVDV